MDKIESVLRDGLRQAVADRPPLRPIDLDEVVARSATVTVRPPRRRAPRWLAAVASLLLVAGIGTGAWLWRAQPATVPASPMAPLTPAPASSSTASPPLPLPASAAPPTPMSSPGLPLPASSAPPTPESLPALPLPASSATGSVAGAVQVRVRNASDADFASVEVRFPDGTRVRYGPLRAGAASAYAGAGTEVYSYAWVKVTTAPGPPADGRTLVLQPTDYVGEKKLAPGSYTYALSLDDRGELTLDLD